MFTGKRKSALYGKRNRPGEKEKDAINIAVRGKADASK